MAFYADLHIHSKYSRATSKHCDLEHLAFWACKKGITVVGTGDFTHPAWMAELKAKLIPAEPGLFRLRPEPEREILSWLPPACQSSVRFMLSVEISTIYKKGDATRKVHHLIYAPDFAAAERIIDRLGQIGNLGSDGRPILGLDSRHLLEIVLESGPDSYLVPAHIWTPWFAAMGSKSGFDSIDDCYADLAPHIFAVETGLSSDPPMNWRVSSLDRFRLVSNSDAHSPEKLAREACVFDTDIDYFAIRNALETGVGYEGTVEFFPEEGKYYLDGHRNCNVCLSPRDTRSYGGKCPVCSKPLTVGVMHRVEDLADREEDDTPPDTAGPMQSLVPLPEILSEIFQVGAKSKRVAREYDSLLGQLGPELTVLNQVPFEDIGRTSPLMAEAIMRLRRQEVIREAGFDGEYGKIRLFQEGELDRRTASASLFKDEMMATPEPELTQVAAVPIPDVPDETFTTSPEATSRHELEDMSNPASETGDLLAQLDVDQRRAAEILDGPLLIVAGPGSGKTRTLTYRIAHLVQHHGVAAEKCMAITFTRRAAEEMRQRLRVLLDDVWQQIPIMTFHALGLSILQEHWNAAGLQRGFRLAGDAERLTLLQQAQDISESQARRLLSVISRAKRTRTIPKDARHAQALDAYQHALEVRNLVDYDDLIGLAAEVLESDAGLRAHYQERYAWVCIDEYQDIDEQQVRLIKLLVPPDGNLCAIGDPDQAIYGFRGGDARFFEQFPQDFPRTQIVRLTRNYRSDPNIVTVSSQVMAPSGSALHSIPVSPETSILVTMHEAPTERAEAEFVVQTLEQLLGGHSFFSIDSGRSVDYDTRDLSFSDFAILYRTEAQTPALIEALQRSGMPFQKHSHRLLMEHPGVPLLIDLMQKGEATGSLWERLEAAFQHADQDADLAAIAEASGLLKPLAQACGEDWKRFLAELAVGAQVDTWDARADRISLLTLHAVKGLEFPVVFIVGCEAGILPLTWGGQIAETELAEDRRLFYVGITRAQTRLYLCHAQKRLWRRQVKPMTPSPYLADIEERLLAKQRLPFQGERSPKKVAQLELF
jgi:DNA helicase-2/ATP-dependent DNA helicase PcrA